MPVVQPRFAQLHEVLGDDLAFRVFYDVACLFHPTVGKRPRQGDKLLCCVVFVGDVSGRRIQMSSGKCPCGDARHIARAGRDATTSLTLLGGDEDSVDCRPSLRISPVLPLSATSTASTRRAT